VAVGEAGGAGAEEPKRAKSRSMWLTLDGDLSERSDDEGYKLAPRNSSETDGDWRINAADLCRTMSGGPSPPGSQTGPALAKYAAIAKQHYAATTNQGTR
jgi:hypothetical protein